MIKTLNRLYLVLPGIFGLVMYSCSKDLEAIDKPQQAGRVVIIGYAQSDSIQITANEENLEINNQTAFINRVSTNYEFVYFNHLSENIKINNHLTGENIYTQDFTEEMPIDTLSFFYKPGIWIEDVLSYHPGNLSQTGYTGYRFIFPNMNRYSNSGYEGALDGIIRKVNGQELGVVENINTSEFSTFLEFPYGAPPILIMKLVKHGTTDSYVPGTAVEVQMVMQNNKSRLIVLEELQDENGNFSGVSGTIDLTEYFTF